ncbi:hypothetical protein [Acinetobacter gyllenbergii]|uniref:hypothetical protein n=1 Tax=Acinetobacter gyllenbergii TaxID=134534 RepID=UPI0003BE6418|nr:hypothetical protein [Acinetobacter gyllenbergii]ESK44024.1 hypothetical protein F987_01950 [Acinetobacter gyllenbergii NIPH 230]
MIVEIEIPFWQDPQCHVFTQYYRDDLITYFTCWDDNAELIKNKLGEIFFNDVLSVKIESEIRSYLIDEPEYRSSIYEVLDSKVIRKYLKKRKKWEYSKVNIKDYRCFVVNSHDYQIVIIAKKYTFKLISVDPHTEVIYKKILELN